MPKSMTLGNGHLLICFDSFGQVKDFYYHYAGLENHVSENLVHKIGVFVDSQFSWIDDGSWKVEVNCKNTTMASEIKAKNLSLGLEVSFEDVVYNEKNIFIRRVAVKNEYDRKRTFKIFFNHQFNIGEMHRGDTAYYDPENLLIHYGGRRVFLINVDNEGKGFDEYSTGIFGLEGKEGTFKDAEDGELAGGAIEHGQVDSVIGVKVEIEAKSAKTFYYWICVGKSVKNVKRLNDYVKEKSPSYLLLSTENYWKAWLYNQKFSFYGLGDDIVNLFNKSLIIIRTHVNKNGSIIASGDSSMLQYGRDTYGYMWPRDAAISAIALAKAGDFNASRRFFEFCHDVISPEGYFMHKYLPDKALGSSWHPWVREGKAELPIQEDQTALVIYALWTHFELSKDLEFVESVYNTLIKRAAEFMVKHRDEKTGLPKPSYDLWEMKFGISTFTASSVYGALIVASKFADLLGKKESASCYLQAAEEIKSGILKHLYNKEEKTFYKILNVEKGTIIPEKTFDISSIYGIYKFGVLSFDDPKLKEAVEKTLSHLEVKTDVGGVARFEGDIYHFKGGNVPGNPWFVTTLWMTQYFTEFVKKETEIAEIVKRFTWVTKWALPSGILSEQIDAYTGQQLSAAPLTWSHAEYVISIVKYLEKLEELGICQACYPIK